MPHAAAAEIYYEVFGETSAPLVVLLSGGGAQMLSWREDFIALLVDEGLRVVRMDNRDTGLSRRYGGPDDVDGGYGLSDMADDVIAVLDELGVDAAHLVGHSMGGMMAQMAAIDHPERVKSLGLLSTIPGQDRRYVLHGPRPELLEPPQRITREQAVEGATMFAQSLSTGRYPIDVAWMAEAAGSAYDRGYFPEGFSRQWSALLRAPERLEALRSLTIPAFVFHGKQDDTLHWAAAVDMADALVDAELQVHPHMGHLIVPQLWPEIVAGIARTVRRAEGLPV